MNTIGFIFISILVCSILMTIYYYCKNHSEIRVKPITRRDIQQNDDMLVIPVTDNSGLKYIIINPQNIISIN